MPRARLMKVIHDGEGFSEEQYGFHEGHFTVGTIRRVVDTLMNERVKRNANHRDVLLVTIDLKNTLTRPGGTICCDTSSATSKYRGIEATS